MAIFYIYKNTYYILNIYINLCFIISYLDFYVNV